MIAGLLTILLYAIKIAITVFLLIMAHRAVNALEASARALQHIAQNFRKSNEENR